MTLRGGEDSGDEIPLEATSAESSTSSSSSKLSQTSSSYPTSVFSNQGYRKYMEDEYFVSPSGDFVAVFDGHGGSSVSVYLRKNLYASVQAILPGIVPTRDDPVVIDKDDIEDTDSESSPETTLSGRGTGRPASIVGSVPTYKDFKKALVLALEKVDREVQRISHWSYQGSTAVVVWIHEDRLQQQVELDTESKNKPRVPSNNVTEIQRTVIVANIGDSRAVLCRNDTAFALTRDHKPNDPIERTRIEKSGGKVTWNGDVDKELNPIEGRGVYRVNGILALSRAIGDRSERPHVTAKPDIVTFPVEEKDEFIILATDGLWDVIESVEAVDLIQRLIQQGLPRDRVATWIVEESLRRGTYDNVTVVIIWLDRGETSTAKL